MIRSDFFNRRDAHPVALGTACDLIFGEEWLTWDIRTTRDELKFAGYATTELSSQKLAAYVCCKTTIGPWADWEIFENVGQALNNNITNFEVRQPLSVAECAVAVDCLRKCRIVTFTDDVKKYIASCAAVNEFLCVPDPLMFVMPHLCPTMYYCEEHGGVEVDDLVDGHCDLCSGRYEDGELIDAPLEGLEGRGTSIKRFSAYEYAPILQKYQALSTLDLDLVQLDMNEVDIQVAKMLDVNSYRKKRMGQLSAQLEELKS